MSRELADNFADRFIGAVREMRRECEPEDALTPEECKECLHDVFAHMESRFRTDQGFMRTDEGSTAIVVAVSHEHLVVANLGDSRAVLCRNGELVELSEDHKPNKEGEMVRIIAAHGFVGGPKGDRIFRKGRGSLSVSRAFGDFSYKQQLDLPPNMQMVTAEPDVRIVERKSTDSFLFLGCDGVFERFGNQQVVDFLGKALSCADESIAIEALLDQCVAPSKREAYAGQGGDNVSAIIVRLDGVDKENCSLNLQGIEAVPSHLDESMLLAQSLDASTCDHDMKDPGTSLISPWWVAKLFVSRLRNRSFSHSL